jgi:tetratricopeptide (TPR) repeat protein
VSYVEAAPRRSESKQLERSAYRLALGWFALGLMTKPMLITLPLTLLLLDLRPLRRLQFASGEPLAGVWPLLREKLPFFALTATSCVVTLFAQQGGGTVASLADLPATARIVNSLLGYVGYLGKLCWPRNLAVIYPLDPGYSPAELGFAIALLLGLSVVALARARRQPWLTMGWFWFGITLLPVIGLVQVGLQSMADRYTYVPATGLFAAVVWQGLDCIAGRPWRRRAAQLAAGAALAGCLVGSWFQLGHWRNSTTLFQHALSVTRDNYIAQTSLGHALMTGGKPEAARPLFEEVLSLRPDHVMARHNLAVCLAEQGQLEAALAQCDRLLETAPDYVAAHHLAGVCLARLGRANEAVARFQRVLQLAPDHGPARSQLALLLADQGDDRAAAEALAAALRSQESPELRHRLGNCLLRLGRVEDAIAELRAAIRLDPGFAEAHNDLAGALVRLGDRDAAMPHLREAVRVRPDFAEARASLAGLLGRTGQWTEAAEQYRAVLQSQPSNAQVHFELAIALLNLRMPVQAVAELRESLRLQPRSAATLNALAFVLATATDARVRDPEEAVRLAGEACGLSQRTNAFHLETLGVAHAAMGSGRTPSGRPRKRWQWPAPRAGPGRSQRFESAWRRSARAGQASRPHRDSPRRTRLRRIEPDDRFPAGRVGQGRPDSGVAPPRRRTPRSLPPRRHPVEALLRSHRPLRHQSQLLHRREKGPPALRGHRADPLALLRFEPGHRLHLADAEGEDVEPHLRVFRVDSLVRRLRLAQVPLPPAARGLGHPPDQVRLRAPELIARDEAARVRVVARVGQHQHLRVAPRLPRHERLADVVGLLPEAGIVEKRRDAPRVGNDLDVAQGEALLEEGGEGVLRRDGEGHVVEVAEPANAPARVHHDAARALLQRRQKRPHLRAGGPREDHLVGVGDAELDLARSDPRRHRHVHAPGLDLDLEAGRGVLAVDEGGEVAAVLRLGEPVQEETDHLGIRRRRAASGRSRATFRVCAPLSARARLRARRPLRICAEKHRQRRRNHDGSDAPESESPHASSMLPECGSLHPPAGREPAADEADRSEGDPAEQRR